MKIKFFFSLKYKGTKYEGEDYENVVCHLFEEIIKYVNIILIFNF